jgi:hypothetical protein
MIVIVTAISAYTYWEFSTAAQKTPLQERLETMVAFELRLGPTPDQDIILYSYLGDRMPDKLDEREVVSMRNASSYTVRLSTPEEESQTGKYRMEYRGVPQPTYYQSTNGTWYYLNYSTSTPQQFRDATSNNVLSYLFGRVAYAVNFNSVSAGDGYVSSSGNNAVTSWADTRGGTGPASVTAVPAGVIALVRSMCGIASSVGVERGFFPFNTSSIPISASISSSSIQFSVNAQSDTLNDAQSYVTVVESTQATDATLSASDFNSLGTIEGVDVADRLLVGTSGVGTTTFKLNATGRSWIKRSGEASSCSATSGISCFALREGHDRENVQIATPIAGCPATQVTINVRTANNVTVLQPLLMIDYPLSFAPWQFWDY